MVILFQRFNDSPKKIKINKAKRKKKNKPFFKPIRTKPFGKYSTRRQGGVLRYPMELMTQETDYLQIDIQKYIPLKNYLSTLALVKDMSQVIIFQIVLEEEQHQI